MASYLIIGMHRSGTSLVTKLLSLSGCDLGPLDRLLGPAPGNPVGFFENRDVVALNDQTLSTLGASWRNVSPLFDGISGVDDGAFAESAKGALAWASDAPLAVKDPRLSLLLPLWRHALDSPEVVVAFRDPAEVAHSLHSRNGMSLELGAALWEYYTVRSIEGSKGLGRHFVHFGDLLDDPAATLGGLLGSIGETKLSMPSDSELSAAVDHSLYRSQSQQITDRSFVTAGQQELYERLLERNAGDDFTDVTLSPESLKTLTRGTISDPSCRVAVVVQGCRLPQFEASLAACRSTWASATHPKVDVWFAYGNGCDCHQLSDLHLPGEPAVPNVAEGEVFERGDLLLLGCSDLVAHRSDSLLNKRLLSLDHLLQTSDHDAFLLICASSYIDQEVLADHVSRVPLDMVFQGPTFLAESGRPIVSGSAMLLSRDLAERLVKAAPQLLATSSYRYADDVSISDWVAANVSDTSPEEMVSRLEKRQTATTDNTFIQPPSPMLNFVKAPAEDHKPAAASYHYHFATDKPQTMRDFHAKYFRSPSTPLQEATIFIQIASYRDSDLPRTITSAIERSDNPRRLRFGICWQWDEDTLDDLDPFVDDDRFRIDEVYYRKSDGCTWARNRANRLFTGEDYYLQIDAHMRFEPGWDTTLINMLEAIDAPKPVLSVYPPAFETDGEGNDTFLPLGKFHVLSLASINEALQTRQATIIASDQQRPGKSPLIAAGFLFAHGSFCAEIPYDPFGYYAGEEISLAARAYTSGYDFYYPTETVVWHRYSHGEPLHWGDKPDSWTKAEFRSRDRLVTLLVGEHQRLSPYGLGTARTIADFEEYCGISFQSARDGNTSIASQPS